MKGILAPTVLASCSLVAAAAAQTVPSEPVSFGEGRVVIGGDAAVSIAPEDRSYFNYSNYDHNTLREFRLGMTAQVILQVRMTDKVDHDRAEQRRRSHQADDQHLANGGDHVFVRDWAIGRHLSQ